VLILCLCNVLAELQLFLNSRGAIVCLPRDRRACVIHSINTCRPPTVINHVYYFKYTSLATVSSLHKPRVLSLHRRREHTCISISRLRPVMSLLPLRFRWLSRRLSGAILPTAGACNCKPEPVRLYFANLFLFFHWHYSPL
jgi:hypothetical protein